MFSLIKYYLYCRKQLLAQTAWNSVQIDLINYANEEIKKIKYPKCYQFSTIEQLDQYAKLCEKIDDRIERLINHCMKEMPQELKIKSYEEWKND